MDKENLKKGYENLMRADKEVNVCYDAIRTQEETALRTMEQCIVNILETRQNKVLPLSFNGNENVCSQSYGMVAEGENITLKDVCLGTNSKGDKLVVVNGSNDDIGEDYQDLFNHLDLRSACEVWIAVKGIMGSLMLEKNLL